MTNVIKTYSNDIIYDRDICLSKIKPINLEDGDNPYGKPEYELVLVHFTDGTCVGGWINISDGSTRLSDFLNNSKINVITLVLNNSDRDCIIIPKTSIKHVMPLSKYNA